VIAIFLNMVCPFVGAELFRFDGRPGGVGL
jgi:hypothetical protein